MFGISKRTITGAALLLAISGLSACNSIEGRQMEAPPKSTPSAPPAPSDDELLSRNERQLVLLFKALLQMEKKEELKLTRSQAESLLPLIRKNSTEGELTATDMNLILVKLSGPQIQYFAEFQKIKPKRVPDGLDGKGMAGLTKEEREKRIEEFESQRRHEPDKDPQNTDFPPFEPARGGPIPPGVGMNVEKQLIELLESKLNP